MYGHPTAARGTAAARILAGVLPAESNAEKIALISTSTITLVACATNFAVDSFIVDVVAGMLLFVLIVQLLAWLRGKSDANLQVRLHTNLQLCTD